ncbi:hypothetical protein HAX54_048908 [Datura stramonium]|uniref:Uncharacterized protein n=1 Tax=Datura stramonium TaxID=4076 RepID=A0ABS8WNN3_DATST|nr:hypothetical protein [Datura stramonium]
MSTDGSQLAETEISDFAEKIDYEELLQGSEIKEQEALDDNELIPSWYGKPSVGFIYARSTYVMKHENHPVKGKKRYIGWWNMALTASSMAVSISQPQTDMPSEVTAEQGWESSSISSRLWDYKLGYVVVASSFISWINKRFSIRTGIKGVGRKEELVNTLYKKHQHEKQANKRRYHFGRLEVHEIAAFVLNSTGNYEAINRNCPSLLSLLQNLLLILLTIFQIVQAI